MQAVFRPGMASRIHLITPARPAICHCERSLIPPPWRRHRSAWPHAAARAQHAETGQASPAEGLPSAAERMELDALAQNMAQQLQFASERMPDDSVLALQAEEQDVLAEAAPESQAATRGLQAVAGLPARPSSRRARQPRSTRPATRQIPFEDLPKVAIVGRPNVGKSALFNRIAGKATAIVFDYPGVTRDRLYTRADWGASEFALVDTGGLMSEALKLATDKVPAAVRAISAAGLPAAIERQAAAGVAEANVVILVMDGQQGITAADEEVVSWLRRSHSKKPVLLAINKCESPTKADLQLADFWGLGLEPLPVSAISGSGTGELMEALVALLPQEAAEEVEQTGAEPIALAIVGRPNVGKSSILNALTGRERSIVSSVSGTTRDAIDTELTTADGQRFTLIDTAGVRKRVAVAASKDGAEPLSVQRALAAVRRSDVVALVLDAVESTAGDRFEVTQQDFRLAELIAAEGRACVIVVNKWDAITDKTSTTLDALRKDVLACLRPLHWAAVVFTSAVTGQRLPAILTAAAQAGEQHRRRVSTATLNMVLQETLAWKTPPSGPTGKRGRIYYATQASTRPPTFVFFVNNVALFGDEYRRYCERQLRENIGLAGTPLRLLWRGKPGKDGSSAAAQA